MRARIDDDVEDDDDDDDHKKKRKGLKMNFRASFSPQRKHI